MRISQFVSRLSFGLFLCISTLLTSCRHAPEEHLPKGPLEQRTNALPANSIFVDGTPLTEESEPELYKNLYVTEQALRYADALEKNKTIRNHFRQKWMAEDEVLGDGIEAYLEKKSAEYASAEEAELKQFFRELGGNDADYEALKPRVLDEYIKFKSTTDLQAEIDRIESAHQLKIPFADWYPGDAHWVPTGRTPFIGSEDGLVRLTIFSDFECPYCARADTLWDVIAVKNQKNVRVEYIHYPLSFHENAKPAAIASICAMKQSQFIPYKKGLYANQSELGPELYQKLATDLKLDLEAFANCLKNPETLQKLEADIALGNSVGVRGTPSIYIDGYAYDGEMDPESLQERIDLHLSAKQ